ncbi:MAG: aminotransferase class I/II-fold pyridoxal phosphate-dependent enzyme [Chloroflexi bacterium]|nr:aminotransferase class I/II-fold pyridoxal phosphate-dependent enzyme [Chloroflexota bacterium]
MQVPFVDLRAQYETIRSEVHESLDAALESMDLMLGPNVRAFEAEFAAYCRTRYAVGVGSGTDALYLALRGCGIRPGDEVITVSHSFIATVEAIVRLGASPVFVDVDPHTYTMDPSLLARAIGPRTRAIVPVHLYGQMADMEGIMAIAKRYGLVVVEDACQAHGATDHGRRAGSVGNAAAFSFYMSKNLGAYGEAGAVTTNSRAVAQEVQSLRDHGARRRYEHDEMGDNSRLDEVQAAVLRVKMRYLDGWNGLRQQHAERYRDLLQDAGVDLPEVRSGATHVYHLFVAQTGDRDTVRQQLQDRGVATGIHYPIPIHQQHACDGVGRIAGRLDHTEELVRRILSLPMYPELQDEQLSCVASSLQSCLLTASQLRVGH